MSVFTLIHIYIPIYIYDCFVSKNLQVDFSWWNQALEARDFPHRESVTAAATFSYILYLFIPKIAAVWSFVAGCVDCPEAPVPSSFALLACLSAWLPVCWPPRYDWDAPFLVGLPAKRISEVPAVCIASSIVPSRRLTDVRSTSQRICG